MSISSSTPQHGGYTNYSLLEGDVKAENEPKMDVILTLSFKLTAEVEITKHTVLRPTLQTRMCIVVL